MSAREDAYGTQKRLAFVSGAIQELGPSTVLDAGCGTGEQLTWPLALAHPRVRFVGIDSDPRSIRHASATCLAPNLAFRLSAELEPQERFDLVIASEVLEHVEAPAAFLAELRARLAPGGRMVATVPNGYGPAELASFVETLLALTGLLGGLRILWRTLRGRRGKGGAKADTLAISPHVNFFTWGELQRVFSSAGLQPLAYRPRTLLCGFGFDALVRGERVVRWNAAAPERLPPAFASDWMFLLEPAGPALKAEHVRGGLARLRRRANEKRWALH